ncbi:hypothetical protein CI105_03605 [Candidatus Izimaplasma bacterium ZiA1]|uniref:HD domain-containing phosphohydrolase n=1 Tax=Candidatus Izimoplasma sp. ZiA1 TaxID=2024899 RepID=UPI000BAA7A70|nr:hypothetical protein CI105_03605 [Candidatus Izimaplasma bacterium ZiA1]
MFDLTVEASLFVLTISYFVSTIIVFFIMQNYKKNYRGLFDFVIFYGISTIATLLILFRVYLPTFLSVFTANILLLVGRFFLLVGILKFINKKFKSLYIISISIGYLFAFIYFTYILNHLNARIVIYSLTMIFIHMVIILNVLYDVKNKKYAFNFMLCINLLIVINLIIRIIRLIIARTYTNNLFEMYSDSYFMVTKGVLGLGLVVALFSMISSKLMYSLKDMNKNLYFFANIYRHSPIPVLVGSVDGEIIHYNTAFKELVDYKSSATNRLLWVDIFSVEDLSSIMSAIEKIDVDEHIYIEHIYVNNSLEKLIPVDVTIKVSENSGNLPYYEFFIFNASDRVMTEENLRESERSKASLLSNLPGFAYRCKNDEFWTMQVLSKGFERITGYRVEECINNKEIAYSDIILDEFKEKVKSDWEKCITLNKVYIGEYKIRTKSNEERWVFEQGNFVSNEYGEESIEGYIADITDRKVLEEKLEFLSFHDPLTGLYNRRYIEEELVRLDTKRNLPITLIMGDLDGLKFINDSFGHQYGDEIIKVAANVFRENFRSDDIIARVGGDEFMIILPKTTKDEADEIIERITQTTKKIKNTKVEISISLGSSSKTNESLDMKKVIKDAEDTMYKSKLYKSPSIRRNSIDTILATLYEKDIYSESHSKNVSKLSTEIAKVLGMLDKDIKEVETAGLLHDIGKIIIPTDILNSSKKLTKEEFQKVKSHPEIGYRILNAIRDFKSISLITLYHHERIDGLGYPKGLKGDEIPVASRIISVADAYDAMTNERKYKKQMTKDEAIEELKKNSGTQFDKKVVIALLKYLLKTKRQD